MTEQAAEKKVTKRRVRQATRIEINSKLCKRCGICSSFCPENVLAPGPDGCPEVVHPDLCTNCQMCFYRCPDFAIHVEVLDDVQPKN
ncbi:MAG: 4Fe-4S dicluster domain-containing protein [Bacillota bacterium]